MRWLVIVLALPGCLGLVDGPATGCDAHADGPGNGWAPPLLQGETDETAARIAAAFGDELGAYIGASDGQDHAAGAKVWQTRHGEVSLMETRTGIFARYDTPRDIVSGQTVRDAADALQAPGFAALPNVDRPGHVLAYQSAVAQGFTPDESVELSATSQIRLTAGQGRNSAYVMGLSTARLEPGMLDRPTITQLAYDYDVCMMRQAGHMHEPTMPPAAVASQHIPLGVFDGHVVRVVQVRYEATAAHEQQPCAANGNEVAVDAWTGRIHGWMVRRCPELVQWPHS